MKKSLLFICVLILSKMSYSQTLLFSEDFESGGSNVTLNTTDMGGTTTGINPWIINNIYAGGSGTFFCPAFGINVPFTVPAAPQQPAGITNSPTSTHLHVTPQIAIDGGGSLPAASYVVADGFCIFGGQSTFTRMNTDINTIGQDSVTLDFWWACGGSAMYFGEVYYSLNGGTTWSIVGNPLNSSNNWIGQAAWVNTIVSNPAWANQATLRFGFRFVSGNSSAGSELDPGFEIDDIEVKGFPACSSTSSSMNATGCNSYVSPSGNYTWTSSNTYTDTLQNSTGCDSVITVNLTINNVDTSITTNGIILISDETGGSYQWLDCNNSYAVIAGATSQNYAPTANGTYAVQVTGSCTDTSECVTVTTVGINGFSNENGFSVYPNPLKENMTIDLGAHYSFVRVKITGVTGQIIIEQEFSDSNILNLVITGTPGLYFLEIITEDGKAGIFKVLKE